MKRIEMRLFCILVLLGLSNSYKHKWFPISLRKMNSLYNSISEEIEFIQKYRPYFDKEPASTLFQDISNKQISEIFVNKDYTQIVSLDNKEGIPSEVIYDHYHLTNIDPIIVKKLLENALDNNINTHFIDFTPESILSIQNILKTFLDLGNFVFPLFFLFILLQTIVAQFRNPMPSPLNMNQRGPGGGLFPNFNKNSINQNELTNVNVSLSSWAGSPEVLEECREVVNYLENKELFQQIGAEMPKGILLEGPPGTGKTLLAKGIATETNSSFISISGSEFVELFVGMGASRVRDLFTNARNNKPCVIFIDEIDAVGRQRGTGINMANDEREQTLNQILYEMDGFNNNEDILVLAATNRKDVLDQALLRPGRFDRIIRVPLPDKYSRQKILEFYLNKKPIDNNIDIPSLAEITDGFSGAQLKNLINEAAILTAKQNQTSISETNLFHSLEKLIVGLIRNNNDVSLATKQRVSLHECGHAFLAFYFKEYFELQKVSIQATYNGAGGYTLFTEKPEIREGGLYTKDILQKRLIITLGGKAAEFVYYGEDFVSLGAVEDLRQANKLAQQMIGNFGMGKELEVFYNENINGENNPFLGRSLSMDTKYSDNRKFQMDTESLSLVVDAYTEAKNILYRYKDTIIEMAELLKNNTVLKKEDIQQFLDPCLSHERNIY